MSIASQLQAYQNGLTDAYNMVSQKGGTMPVHKNMSSLASSIATISGGGGFIGLPREVSSNGTYQMPSGSFTFSLPSNATSIGDFAMTRAFYGCSGLVSADLSPLVTVSGSSAFLGAFWECTNLTSIDFSSMTTISGANALESICYGCVSLTSVEFSSLTTLGANYALYRAFRGCTNLASLSFPALTAASFGSSTNQFHNLLSGCSGVTVHFPDGMQTVIAGLLGYPGFGGTNTTVLFDL